MSLPAADELFRTTGGSAVQPSTPSNQNHINGEESADKNAQSTTRVPAPAGGRDSADSSSVDAAEETDSGIGEDADSEAGDGGGSEHSAAGEGDESGAEGGATPGGPASGGSEHTGRDSGEGPDRQPGPRRSVPGQGNSQGGVGRSGGGQGGSAGAMDVPPRQSAGPVGGPAAKSPQQTKSSRTAEPRTRQPAGSTGRRGGRGANRRPSGRERHDEKITVYVSAEELMDLEHARLVLRGEHGLAVDRGRIVREAVAVVLADLESRGDASILVRRLRGR
ncbi:hypothetical protein [Streptomyces marispadix]|uniref:Uncharacterized protein n=1 Tax=Streptomyces marispadix TaxID=2922868 RepID=A0ABS9STA6_9ACTN|nr:hypothetical protein [Streptomyces marispadix]MCH6159513.1 hypothetical protein [Streptomyces marispadix]